LAKPGFAPPENLLVSPCLNIDSAEVS